MLLQAEKKFIQKAGKYLPTTEHLLDAEQLDNLVVGETGVAAAERMVPGNNRSPYFLQHVQRYLWAMSCCQGKSVVELGCGEGYGTEMLAWVANQITGVDISSSAVDAARNKYTRPDFIALDLESEETWPKGEVAVCFEVIEHLYDPFPILRRALDNYDRLLFSVPNPLLGGTHINPHHFSDRSLRQWKKAIRETKGSKKVRLYHQGLRSASVRKGASLLSGVWLFDISSE